MKVGKIGQVTFAIGLILVALLAMRLFIIPDTTSKSTRSHIDQGIDIDLGDIPLFAEIKDIPTKKQAFFDYFRPAIQAQNQIIMHDRQFLIDVIDQIDNGQQLSDNNNKRLNAIFMKYDYNVKLVTKNTLMPLLKRIDIIPVNMVLIQAANESGWGSSRFAVKGNNFFGQWCFSKGCGLVPLNRDSGKDHEVAVYDSPKDSIIAYMNNLNTHSAYRLFRSIRADLRDQNKKLTADKLIYGLINYSERKEEYIDELLEMLKHNKSYLQGNNADA